MTRRVVVAVVVAVVLAIALVAVASVDVAPVRAVAPTPSVTLDPVAPVAPGGTVDLVATAPVLGSDSLSETIVQQVDPQQVHLTSTAQIRAPQGWTVLYSTDGVQFTATAPSSPSQWSAVRAVKATGPLVSKGYTSVGDPIVESAATVVPPPSVSFIQSATGGDGFDVVFDSFDHAFNIFHHNGADGLSGALACHLRSTGATCPGSWPFNISRSGINTLGPSNEYLDETNHHIWFATTTMDNVTIGGQSGSGFMCIDVSNIAAPNWCGGSMASAYRQVTTTRTFGTNAYNVLSALSFAAGRVFAVEGPAGRVWCLDPYANGGAGALCPTPFVQFPGVTTLDTLNITTQTNFWAPASMRSWKERIYVASLTAPARVLCIDPLTMGACAGGWATPKSLPNAAASGGQMTWNYEQPSANGGPSALCWLYTTGVADCFTADGSTATVDVPLSWILKDRVGLAYGGGNDPVVVGTKVLFVPLYHTNTHSVLTNGPYCWDVATSNWCTGWSATTSTRTTATYTIRVDPANGNCFWTNSDPGKIVLWDITGVSSCVSPPNLVTFQSNLPPQLGCTVDSQVKQWDRFTLTSPVLGTGAGAQAVGARLSVQDANGTPLAGWQDLPIPASLPATSPATAQSVDLSALRPSVSGQQPRFVVTFGSREPVPYSASATITAVGTLPQLCLTPTVTYTCPTTPGPLPVLAPQTSTVTASASTTTGSNAVVPIDPATTAVTISPPTPTTCGSGISGRARDTASAPVAGVTVALLDGGGQPVTWPPGTPSAGQPVTVTTAADGTYSFPPLAPGSYSVAFVDRSPSLTVVDATTVSGSTGTAPGTAPASGGRATSPTVAVAVGTAGVVDSTFLGVLTTAPASSAGVAGAVQTLRPLLGAAPSSGATVVATSMRLCAPGESSPNCSALSLVVPGEGVFTVGANGEVTFTPCSAVGVPDASCIGLFAGPVTQVRYQVSDTSGRTASSTLDVMVSAEPVAAPDATSGPVGRPQSASVLANDATGGRSLPLLASTLQLCDANQVAPNCTATTLTVAGEGTYSVDQSTGVVTFTPCSADGTPTGAGCTAGFTGTASGVVYQAANSLGQVASSRYTPTVVPLPVVTQLRSSAPPGVGQSATVIDSGTPGLVADTIALCAPGQVPPSCTATTVAVDGQGVFEVDRDLGVIRFHPAANFVGEVTPVTFQVSDGVGQVASSTYAPVVTPTPPSALPLTGADLGRLVLFVLALVGGGTLLMLPGLRRRRD